MTQPPVVPTPYYPAPPLPLTERVRAAYLRRHDTDYVFSFWTAFGWSVLTCGVYLFYVLYQLVRRSREHNLRRLELLDAANAVAWERATAQGLAEELRPNFERVAVHLGVLRGLTTRFRDPVAWLVIAIAAGLFSSGLGPLVVEAVLYVFLDGDLVAHDYDEGGAENELAYVFTRLGTPMTAPDPSRLHQPENYAGRIVASIFTCGIYLWFWLYNIMDDGNRHFAENWVWEDSLAQAVQAGVPAGEIGA